MIDIALVVVIVLYAVSGFRQGALVGLLSFTGFVGGAALAMWGLPRLLDSHLSADTSDLRRIVLVLAGVLLAATIGQALAVGVGHRLRRRVTAPGVRLLDQAVGAIASLVAVCVLISLLAVAVRGGPSERLSRTVASSKVVAAIDSVVPSDVGRLFSGFRGLLDAEGFPRVFEGLGPEDIRSVPAPDPNVVRTKGIRAAARSVVKIVGNATVCSRAQEGSGWVLAKGVVVTNAHVVAGVRQPHLRIGGVGPTYNGTVTVYDPVRDLAVISVPDLPAPALDLGTDLSRGGDGVVAGFPLDGPYRLDAARVRDVITARGEDIYGRRSSVRQVYSLYATVQPGNSGGPLLDRDGKVVGVVFAKSLDDTHTGYALTLKEAQPVLDAGRAATRPVSTQGCAAG